MIKIININETYYKLLKAVLILNCTQTGMASPSVIPKHTYLKYGCNRPLRNDSQIYRSGYIIYYIIFSILSLNKSSVSIY